MFIARILLFLYISEAILSVQVKLRRIHVPILRKRAVQRKSLLAAQLRVCHYDTLPKLANLSNTNQIMDLLR